MALAQLDRAGKLRLAPVRSGAITTPWPQWHDGACLAGHLPCPAKAVTAPRPEPVPFLQGVLFFIIYRGAFEQIGCQLHHIQQEQGGQPKSRRKTHSRARRGNQLRADQ